jgi:omega-6 fatty acid desaturase (delta-12 desaturase)
MPTPEELRAFQEPSLKGSLWQLANSLVPYLALWALMIQSVHRSYPLTLLLAVLASGFLVRIFIIFHDCGHGSFFRSRRLSDAVGFLTGLLTLTPYREWWHTHALHHAQAGNLDRRGSGDIWTMTVDEYQNASLGRRIRYFLARQPLLMLTVGPILVFVIQNRFASRTSRRAQRRAVVLTNLALAAVVSTLCLTIGWKAYLVIHLPIIVIAGAGGIWLFYVQHQFEHTYWSPDRDWRFLDAALKGSSFYRLPRLLQWFSGNIGFHHVHHLSPKIPNYRLESCHRAFPALQRAPELTLRASLGTGRLHLWDERRQNLVGWRKDG